MDPQVVAGMIGALAAIFGSLVSHLLVLHADQKKRKYEEVRAALQFALIFLEKLKIEVGEPIERKEYYELVMAISVLPLAYRRTIIDLYEKSLTKPPRIADIRSDISKLQENIVNDLR